MWHTAYIFVQFPPCMVPSMCMYGFFFFFFWSSVSCKQYLQNMVSFLFCRPFCLKKLYRNPPHWQRIAAKWTSHPLAWNTRLWVWGSISRAHKLWSDIYFSHLCWRCPCVHTGITKGEDGLSQAKKYFMPKILLDVFVSCTQTIAHMFAGCTL